jgi:uncharacterized protein HemY
MSDLAAELQRAQGLIDANDHDAAFAVLGEALRPHHDPPRELRALVVYGGGLAIQCSMYLGGSVNEAKRLCEDLLDRHRDDPDPAVQQQLDWIRDLRVWVSSQA